MFSRHDLIWLSADGWDAAAGQVQGADRDAVERWRDEDWPAIVRRRDAGAADVIVPAGVALPPDPEDGNKRRIALHVHASQVVRHLPPLPLSEALGAAPGTWREDLVTLDKRMPGTLRAYGSLALQALTGMQYLTPSSDIDLLFMPATPGDLDAGIAVLDEYAARLPLDGEVTFPTGDAVAWKEWRDACRSRARVLVKSNEAVRLADPAALAATLKAAA